MFITSCSAVSGPGRYVAAANKSVSVSDKINDENPAPPAAELSAEIAAVERAAYSERVNLAAVKKAALKDDTQELKDAYTVYQKGGEKLTGEQKAKITKGKEALKDDLKRLDGTRGKAAKKFKNLDRTKTEQVSAAYKSATVVLDERIKLYDAMIENVNEISELLDSSVKSITLSCHCKEPQATKQSPGTTPSALRAPLRGGIVQAVRI